MIVVCTACPKQYSVPDAKIRGRKVRVTCKHCGTGFVVDATNEPARHEVPLAPATPPSANEDATHRVRPDFSEHDEPTVIGQIPAAALEAERRHAQRTLPPPSEPVPAAPRSLPHDVPEQALATTHIASPHAKRASQASLRPPEANEAALAARASRPSPPQPAAEVKTLLSQGLLEPPAAARPHRSLYWLLAVVVVGGLALLTLTTR